MPPPLVIFDFDGTIADSSFAIGRTAQLALERVGLPAIEEAAFIARIGLPLRQIFAEVAPTLLDAELDAAVVAYRALYPEISGAHTKVFAGMQEILGDLATAGVRLAIATGKSTAGAHHSIARLALDPAWFSCVVGTDAVARPKPHGDMVTHICGELDVAPEASIVVGDTTFDMEMSFSAGAPACGVTWGSHTRTQLDAAGATWVVDTRDQLATILAR